MVPVELQLKNFLSYGTDAPPLDFSRFDVACLSGKNGQGKSALLDAMTWAVWGEARKSSGKRKPDDELIRIGTRHMEVTFVFELEGERYRVMRSFSRSSTGKTTTSELEFQIYVPDGNAYRPLTGATQRETQSTIESTLGLDYDTFINSAFLLQGRSDEFTKKRPSQRKEILASILNLSRYDALARMARDKWREAKQRQQDAASSIERLKEAVAPAAEWKEERTDIKAQIEAKQDALDALRAEEKALTEQRADLEAKVREAEAVRESIEKLHAQQKQRQEDAEQLRKRIDEAEELIARREAIQARYERYQTLQEERDALDEKRDLHRGLEKQIEQKRSAIKDKKNELEKKLNKLDIERKSLKNNLDTCVQKLSQRSVVKEKHAEAQAAQQQLQTLSTRRKKRQHLEDQLTEVEQQIVGTREALRGKWKELRDQIAARKDALKQQDGLADKIAALEAQVEQRKTLEKELDIISERGKKLSNAISTQSGQCEARRAERQKQQEAYERLQDAEDDVCPTCGSELTASHRQEVAASYEQTIAELERGIADLEATIEEKTETRDALREEFATIQAELNELAKVGEQLAAAREQYRAREAEAEALAEKEQEAATLKEQLENDRFALPHRKRRQALRQRIAGYPVDEEQYEAVQTKAAQLDRYEDRLRELEEYAGRKEQLETSIKRNGREAHALREQLDSGRAFETWEQQVEQLQTQLAQVGFDPERFDDVRAALRDLSDAGSQMNDLVNAQQNRDEWQKQLRRIEKRRSEAADEQASLEQKLEQLDEALSGTDDLEARQKAKAEEVAVAEKNLNDLQQRLGELTAKLDQAAADRKKLKEAKARRESAAEDRALYKHLRRAFGKHGIPSLIIEETLPEIEERANGILDRLTDGKMHVRLETLRDKKTGGTKETLEIIITDEQGVPRPYETFSGGESFRVNFALRIALAQLLAERSGVRIRTLVIDEGFGTQDADGIERLVESIQAIQEDFAKIIVITHLPQLKQVFPVRIEVEKDPVAGSSFELLGA
jgi:exonuclease SbcC